MHKVTAVHIDLLIGDSAANGLLSLFGRKGLCKAVWYRISSFRLHNSAAKHGNLV